MSNSTGNRFDGIDLSVDKSLQRIVRERQKEILAAVYRASRFVRARERVRVLRTMQNLYPFHTMSIEVHLNGSGSVFLSGKSEQRKLTFSEIRKMLTEE